MPEPSAGPAPCLCSVCPCCLEQEHWSSGLLLPNGPLVLRTSVLVDGLRRAAGPGGRIGGAAAGGAAGRSSCLPGAVLAARLRRRHRHVRAQQPGCNLRSYFSHFCSEVAASSRDCSGQSSLPDSWQLTKRCRSGQQIPDEFPAAIVGLRLLNAHWQARPAYK